MSLTTVVPWEHRITTAWRIYDVVDTQRQGDPAVLRPQPIGRVRFEVVASEEGGVRRDLPEPLGLAMQQNPSGYHLWFGTAILADGRRVDLEPGGPALVVEITSDFYQRAEDVFVPSSRAETATRIDLAPGYAYPVDRTTPGQGNRRPTVLSGNLRHPDGSGEAGATIDVFPLPAGQPGPSPDYRTDHTGRWLLVLDDAVASVADATVRIRRFGRPTVTVEDVAIAQGDARSLRQASLAGRTVRANGSPLPGVEISIDLVPGISTASDADGRFEFVMPIEQFRPGPVPRSAVLTAAPAAGVAARRQVQIQPRATVSVAEFVFP